jgi:nitrous oxidase accessory protein NosD
MNTKLLTVGIILIFAGTYVIPAIAQNITPSLPSRGNWLYVGGSGPGNYTHIQDALNNATDGDTVFVYSNVYDENLIINKSVQLLGENRQTTSVESVQDLDTILVNGSDINISNFRILANITHFWPSCISIQQSSNVYVYNCECSVTTPYSYCGVWTFESNNISILHSFFHDMDEGIMFIQSFNCRAQNCECYNLRQQSIITNKGSGIYITNCTIHNGSSVFSQGICIFSNETHIENCQIINMSDNGIQLLGDHLLPYHNRRSASIENSTIRDCRNNICAIWVEDYDSVLITNCEITNSAAAAILVEDSEDDLIYRNNFIDNGKKPIDYQALVDWDNGVLGNYWSDSNIKDNNGDLIGDSNYTFDYGVDHFPAMLPFGKTIGVRITHPLENFSYLRNHQGYRPYTTTVLMGTIKVSAVAGTFDSPTVAKVKFYVDGILRHVDTKPPYTWTWRLNSVLMKHTLKVIAEDKNGHITSDQMSVVRLGFPASVKILLAGILVTNIIQ